MSGTHSSGISRAVYRVGCIPVLRLLKNLAFPKIETHKLGVSANLLYGFEQFNLHNEGNRRRERYLPKR
jgi:hypothetical protein